MNKTSIIVDASNYIQDLKQKVETLKQDISTTARSSNDQGSSSSSSSWPVMCSYLYFSLIGTVHFVITSWVLQESSSFVFLLLIYCPGLDMYVRIRMLNINSLSQLVTVKTLEKGILVNVYSGKSCPGLLVSILEAFEEVGLNVLDARVSCEDNFHLQAVGEENEESEESINEQVVKQAVSDAIKNWQANYNEDDDE